MADMSGGCLRPLALGGGTEYVGAEVVAGNRPLRVLLNPLGQLDRDTAALDFDMANHPHGNAKPPCRYSPAPNVAHVLLEELICVHAPNAT